MFFKKPKLTFLLSIATALALAGVLACSSDDDPTAVPAATTSPVDVAATAEARATAVQASALVALAEEKRGQRVEVPTRVAPAAALSAVAVGDQHMIWAPESRTPSNWKPWREGGGNRSWIGWIFMAPFGFDKDNQLVQGFATAYSLSEDAKTYTFHINPDAKFTDGSKITADDVKLAWEYAMQPHEQVGWGGSTRDMKLVVGADAAIAGERDDITGLVALDDENLEITIKENTPTWPYRFAIWMQGVFKADLARDNPEDFFLNPVGAGPYKLSADVDNNELTMTYSGDTWWGDEFTIDTLTGRYISDDPLLLLMFENGDLDVIFAPPNRQPTVYEPTHPMNRYVYDIPYAGLTSYIRFNTAREPFTDINVRKALAHSIDMDQIVKAVFGFGGTRATSALQHDLQCWDPNNFLGYDYDVEKAKQFLAQSQYQTGDNVPLVQVQSNPNRITWNLTLQAWQDAWKNNLGIESKIHIIERGAEIPPDMNLMRGSLGAYVPDPGFLLNNLMHTSQPGVMHVNAELDTKIEAANSLALDDPGRCSAFQAVDRDIMNNYYMIPIIGVDYALMVQPWMLGFETSVNNDFATLNWMKIGEKDRSKY
jgi:peptide/nickel transport system substrate-binding protein